MAVEYRDALVLYRAPLKEGAEPTLVGFVNADHSRYVVEGNVRAEIPAAKPVPRTVADDCFDRLADMGYPEAWTTGADLRSALTLRREDHVLVAEVDGRVRVFVKGGRGTDEESLLRRRRFAESKKALIEATLRSTGFRVIENKEGADLFEKQLKDLERQKREGRR